MKPNKGFIDIQQQHTTSPSTSQGLRDFLTSLIDKHRQTMVTDLNSISPEKRLQTLERLLPYVLPKQAEIKAEVTGIGIQEQMAKSYLEREHLQKEQIDLFGNVIFGRDEEEIPKIREIQFAVLQELQEKWELGNKDNDVSFVFSEDSYVADTILDAVRTYAKRKGIQLRGM